MSMLHDVERIDKPRSQIMGDTYERLSGNRWRRLDGRIVLVLCLEDSDDGELPWRVEVDGELMKKPLTGQPWRYSNPWHAVNDARRRIASA